MKSKVAIIHCETYDDEKVMDANPFNRKLIEHFNRSRLRFNYFMDNSGTYHFKLDVEEEEVKILVEEIKKISAGLHFRLEQTETFVKRRAKADERL